MSAPKVVDLFAGIGGLSLGFHNAEFDVVLAADADEVAMQTYERNLPSVETRVADLTETDAESLFEGSRFGPEDVDIVVGGPPCQGFSPQGNLDPDDERNDLLFAFADHIATIDPDYFLMENVAGLKADRSRDYLAMFADQLESAGFEVKLPYRTLDASDFGVPQRRNRLILLGHREDVPPPEYPEPNGPSFVVEDAICDIPNVLSESMLDDGVYTWELGDQSDYVEWINGFSGGNGSKPDGLTGLQPVDHSEEVVRRFSEVEPGDRDEVSWYKRLELDEPANTLLAGSDRSRGTHTPARPIHPEEPRCITVREAARLQSFPDWFQFHHTKYHAMRHIGNSVPPALSLKLAVNVFN